MTETNNTYGYQEDSVKEVQTGAYDKFGLNHNFKLVKFEHFKNVEGGWESADIHFQSENGKLYMGRIFPVDKVFIGKNLVGPNEGNAEYAAKAQEATDEQGKYFTHILKCFVTEDRIKAALSAQPITSFAHWVSVYASLLPSNFAEKPLDMFLEYQWNIGKNNTRTFLQVPKKFANNYFVIPTAKVGYEEVIGEAGDLSYSLQGETHTFVRNDYFMKGNKANVQKTAEEPVEMGNTQAADDSDDEWES